MCKYEETMFKQTVGTCALNIENEVSANLDIEKIVMGINRKYIKL